MTAPAGACTQRELGRGASRRPLLAVANALVVATCACAAAPAAGEVGAAISVFTDGRFRGYSISNHHPVAGIDLSYDDPSGAYLAASGSAVLKRGGVHPLALKLNAGYARRLTSGVTLDAGIVHSRYSHYWNGAAGHSYTELYAGGSWKDLSARFYVSPHYFETRSSTLYGELEGSLNLVGELRLNGHAGALVPLESSNGSQTNPVFDWKVGLSHQFGRLSAHASWSGRGRLRRYEGTYTRSTNGLVLGVSCAL